jgi:hypothetical protein
MGNLKKTPSRIRIKECVLDGVLEVEEFCPSMYHASRGEP